MEGKAILGATVGAAIGAAIWAAIAALTGYEVGYVAWGVGLAVGFGAHVMGSSTQMTAVVCALLALGSIFVGKMIAFDLAVGDELRSATSKYLTQDAYDEEVRDASDLAAMESDDDLPEFIASHGYSDGSTAEDVTQEEIDWFNSAYGPDLVRLYVDQLTFDEWKALREERVSTTLAAGISTTDLVIEDLGMFDLIFALLGVITAYRVALGVELSDT